MLLGSLDSEYSVLFTVFYQHREGQLLAPPPPPQYLIKQEYF